MSHLLYSVSSERRKARSFEDVSNHEPLEHKIGAIVVKIPFGSPEWAVNKAFPVVFRFVINGCEFGVRGHNPVYDDFPKDSKCFPWLIQGEFRGWTSEGEVRFAEGGVCYQCGSTIRTGVAEVTKGTYAYRVGVEEACPQGCRPTTYVTSTFSSPLLSGFLREADVSSSEEMALHEAESRWLSGDNWAAEEAIEILKPILDRKRVSYAEYPIPTQA